MAKAFDVNVQVGVFCDDIAPTSDEETFIPIQRELFKLRDAGDIAGLVAVAKSANAMIEAVLRNQVKAQGGL